MLAVEGSMVSSSLSLSQFGPIAGFLPGGIGADTISRIEIRTDAIGARGRLVDRSTNNVVVILAFGVRQRKLLRSAAPHALANSASLVE